MIQIYGRDNTNYDNNGDSVLIPTSCGLGAEINGTWELTMSHPLDSEGRWKYIEEEGVIAAPTFRNEKQLFRVEKCIKTDTSIEATAYPIFFDSADDCFLMDVRPTAKNGQEALDLMTAGSKYGGSSDITTGATAYFVRRNLIDAINGEDAPTFVQVWGGEILYDNFNVIINERIGGDHGAEIRYGKNMDGISYTINMANVITRIVPVAYNGRTMSGETPWVDSANIEKYAKIYTREVTFDDVKLAEDASGGEEDDNVIICQDQQSLNEELRKKCEEMYAQGADLPEVTIEVNMVDLAKTDQYKDVQGLVTVGLGDTVKCYNYKLDIETSARIIRLKWDCIRNRSEELVIGNFEYNYFSELTNTLQAVQQVIGPGNTLVAERISGVLNAINTQLRYQKNIAQKQDVRAILFEDTDPDSPTYGAMCLGTQGFQIADKRTEDGKDWDWTTAFTAKGGYAGVLIAGILSDKTGKNFWNLDTGEFQITDGILKSSSIIGGDITIVYKDEFGDDVVMFAANENGVGIGPGGETLVYRAGSSLISLIGELLVSGKIKSSGSEGENSFSTEIRNGSIYFYGSEDSEQWVRLRYNLGVNPVLYIEYKDETTQDVIASFSKGGVNIDVPLRVASPYGDSDTFTSADGKTIRVINGIIRDIT